ncbi:protein of unknown function [Streptococcus thermophilus]|uniref:Uncharacterized protein n=1 Tax=Streptococcus thermophilus TaxID=1308 RepID=A0A8D6UAK6_STRTR|nr:protein of unknown function [Streptococcus thermophilus]
MFRRNKKERYKPNYLERGRKHKLGSWVPKVPEGYKPNYLERGRKRFR